MNKFNVTSTAAITFLLFIGMLSFAQSTNYTDPLDGSGRNKWILAGKSTMDSASLLVKAGKLRLNNSSSKVAYVYRNFNEVATDLMKHDIVDISFSVKHLNGARNMAYGIAISGDTIKPGLFGDHFGIAANGYFILYQPRLANKMHYYNQWQRALVIDTLINATNRLQIKKYRSSVAFFVNDSLLSIVNGGFSNNVLEFFVTKQQQIEVENLTVKTTKSSFSLQENVAREDLKTICMAAENNFRNAYKIISGGTAKTWLPEIYIFQRDNRLFNSTDEEFFAGKVKSTASRMMYSLYYPYTTQQERDDMSAKYKALIEAVLKDFKTKTITTKGVKTTFYSCKNDVFPKGLFIKLEEKEELSVYTKKIQYHTKIAITAAPEVKFF